MISHRHISGWPDQLEDAYDEAEIDEPWFRNLETESDELFPGDESSLYRRRPSRRHPRRSVAERTP